MNPPLLHLERLPLDQAPLKSLRELEFLLGVDRAALRHLASNWRENYAPFNQSKPSKPHTKDPEPGKARRIDNPCKELKQVQTRILERLLQPVTLPNFLFGAVRKKSVRSHAKEHLGAKLVVKMDIKSYYPNVTTHHVLKVWREILHCSPRVAALLTQLTTCEWRLPQGAPTSPALANLFLASIYGPVLAACAERDIIVTVWVDDLTFSGQDAREVMELVRQTLAANGLKDSRKKRYILDSQSTKMITGVRLGKDELRACKLKIREIRAGIHNVKIGRLTSRGRAKDIESLQGKIVYVKSICPRDAAPPESQLREVLGKHVVSSSKRSMQKVRLVPVAS